MEGYDYKLAYDYTEMFRGLLADYPYFSRHVKEERPPRSMKHVEPEDYYSTRPVKPPMENMKMKPSENNSGGSRLMEPR